MASPANFQVTRSLGLVVHNAKINFGKLYLRQIFGKNQSDVIESNTATGLGKTTVNDWEIYDGVGSEAKLVARGQGMHTYAHNWLSWFTMVFEVERFKGSTLQVMGVSFDEPNPWSIVGGTGDFAMAQGVIHRKYYLDSGSEKIHELTIEGYCRMEAPTPTKMGPWGGSGGVLHEMEEKSQRLESVTLRHGDVVEAITSTYINEDGQIRTAGRWGGDHTNPGTIHEITIKFGPSEFVKEITGTVGSPNYLSDFKIITNEKTYGPYGTRVGGPSFNYIGQKIRRSWASSHLLKNMSIQLVFTPSKSSVFNYCSQRV